MSSMYQAQGTPNRQDLGREIERSVQEAIEASIRAAEAAGNAEAAAALRDAQVGDALQPPPEPPEPPMPPGGTEYSIRPGKDGFVYVETHADGSETVSPWDTGNVIPPQVTDIMLIGVLGLIGIIMAFPIGRAIARFIDRRGTVAKVPDEVTHRLTAIEQAVDAVAIEMERMSESNRYTTRLLTERATAPDFAGAARQAVPEPHVRG